MWRYQRRSGDYICGNSVAGTMVAVVLSRSIYDDDGIIIVKGKIYMVSVSEGWIWRKWCYDNCGVYVVCV